MDMDHCSGWVSKEEEIGRFTGPKLTADRVAHRARYPFIWKKDATHGILEMLTHGLPQTPPLTRVVQDRGNKSDNTSVHASLGLSRPGWLSPRIGS